MIEQKLYSNSTIFIAGIYGTGKSTLCEKLSEQMKIPSFSAGDLISSINHEQYGVNKSVSDKDKNQVILSNRVQELNEKHGMIILAGHFCIFSAENDIEILPEFVFLDLHIAHIVLLEADLAKVEKNLLMRDNKTYQIDNLLKLAQAERQRNKLIAQKLSCPLSTYKMTFSSEDAVNVIELIKREDIS